MSEKPPRTFEQEAVFPARALTAEECTHEVVAEVLDMADARYGSELQDHTIRQSALDQLLPAFRSTSIFTLYSSLYSMLFSDVYTPEQQTRMARNKSLTVRLATVQALREKLEGKNSEYT